MLHAVQYLALCSMPADTMLSYTMLHTLPQPMLHHVFHAIPRTIQLYMLHAIPRHIRHIIIPYSMQYHAPYNNYTILHAIPPTIQLYMQYHAPCNNHTILHAIPPTIQLYMQYHAPYNNYTILHAIPCSIQSYHTPYNSPRNTTPHTIYAMLHVITPWSVQYHSIQ